GRLPRRAGEAPVPMPAAAATGDHCALPGGDEVDRAAVDRTRLRPGRHRDLPILSPSPLPVGPFPMPPPLRPEVLAPPQGAKVATRGVAHEHDIATMPAVAPVGPASRYMGLAPERNRAVPTGSSLNPDFRLVVHRSRRK